MHRLPFWKEKLPNNNTSCVYSENIQQNSLGVINYIFTAQKQELLCNMRTRF